MKICNIKKGMVIKNYKEFCNLLEVETKGGCSKKSHIKFLESYFDIERDGRKFIIKNVYDEKYRIEYEIKQGRKSLYQEMLKVIILDYLVKKGDTVVVPKSVLAKEVGFVNTNYNVGYRNQGSLANVLNIPKDDVGDFYNLSNATIGNQLKSSLDRMAKDRWIDFQEIYMVQYEWENSPHKANELDRMILLDSDISAMEYFNITGVSQLSNLRGVKDYYKIKNHRDELLRKRSIVKCYKAYDIIHNVNFSLKNKERITDEVLSKLGFENKLKLNEKYYNRVIESAENRNKKSEEGNRSRDFYVENFKIMADNLLKMDAEPLNMNSLKINIVVEDLLPF